MAGKQTSGLPTTNLLDTFILVGYQSIAIESDPECEKIC